jgi:ASC-1-like (ASCH) protein
MGQFRGGHPAVLLLAVIAGLLLAGCASPKGVATGDPDSAAEAERNAPLYYDFGDVLVPREMKVDKNASFVFRTPGLSAGVLSMKGRVDGHSLITFFENNMANDNWSLVSAFKSYRNIMLFKKENRWCVINITEKKMYTYLEIWVSPTVEGASETLYK